jgi:hypothetical protein
MYVYDGLGRQIAVIENDTGGANGRRFDGCPFPMYTGPATLVPMWRTSMASSPTPQVKHIVHEIDRLIGEMTRLRREVAALSDASVPPEHSVREGEYFGMWADRPDMQGWSSREWLEDLRAQQWTR